jgi:hypothetical protein
VSPGLHAGVVCQGRELRSGHCARSRRKDVASCK